MPKLPTLPRLPRLPIRNPALPLPAALPGLLLTAALVACAQTPDAEQFQVDIQVESDPGKPLAGASVLQDDREQGQTGPDGHVRLALSGTPGDVITLHVTCPSGYASPDQALSVMLRSLVGQATMPRYHASCLPLSRSLVVAIRTKNGADLPVMHQGREVARTDADGTAHVLLTVTPDEHVGLALDTSAANKALLRPRNPEFTMVMPERDHVAVFDQSFTLEQPVTKKRRAHAEPIGPTQILPGQR